ncbi:CoA-acylating methylmalonate-semialdehyde dehydrogenase [candidate division KSB1 bacterium]|nr:CoA-acylating methylmalonate-semialdehyde dehydrogenase [candidate division KSB1 bacterium]
MQEQKQDLKNFIDGKWQKSKAMDLLAVINPATTELMAHVPLSPSEEVDQAIQAASRALVDWRRTPITERIQYLFNLKYLLEEHFEELSRTITMECGKTLQESQGEIRRAIENVEVACGTPMMIQGYNNEDIARGIDEMMIRQPIGVCAIIAPFNFPGMISFWFMPMAIACGNTVIIKPSEKTPVTMQKAFELIEKTGLPKGVVNLVNGANEAVDSILDHPAIRAVSFVGSTPVAKYIYTRAAENGKRAQCQGGAKNPVIVMPDADFQEASNVLAESAFGCAGQRCLAGSLAITVGEARQPFTDSIVSAVMNRNVGYGLDEGVDMGPVITSESKSRIESIVEKSISEGAKPVVDGRKAVIPGYEKGYFIRPTILANLHPKSDVVKSEIFGPVLGLMHFETIEEAIEFVNSGQYGNMACLFTKNGSYARKFRYEVEAGNIGINVGVAAPMAFFPFSGWKDSFYGDLHGQGKHSIEFFTQTKVVIERWS